MLYIRSLFVVFSSVMDSRLRHPFTAIVAGPTSSGKTHFTLKLIRQSQTLITPPPDRIVYCYGIYQNIFDNYPDVEFHDGLPELSMFDGEKKTLLILDDLMMNTDDRVTSIFTRISHHKNVSVLYLTQNLFYKNKQSRTLSLNSHYIVLFKNIRDQTQIGVLARQMFPSKSAFMMEAFVDATSSDYGYLLVDLKPDIEEKFRLRTGIFEGETQFVYVRK